MTHRPPTHVLTRPWVYGITVESAVSVALFGEVVTDQRGRERIFAGCSANGSPFLIPADEGHRLGEIASRLSEARSHHEGRPTPWWAP